MQVLNDREIRQKIRRLAIQILEQNHHESEIYLAGINNNGFHFAQLLYQDLLYIGKVPINLINIRLNPANPLSQEVQLDIPLEKLSGSSIVIADDVANTGRTLFYAMKPLMEILPKKIEVAVLVDRKHKAFPIHVNYVGLALATTLKDHIQVDLKENVYSAYLM